MSKIYIFDKYTVNKYNINNDDYVYLLNPSSEIDQNINIINNSKIINDLALRLKNNYIDFINSINQFFLKENIIYDKTISMFFFSDLFNKRTEKFDTYVSICHILFLKEFIDKNKHINRIITIGCRHEFNSSLSSLIDDIKISRKKEKNNNFKYIKLYILQFSFYIKSILKLILIKVFYKSKNLSNMKNIFLTRYPLHFDKNFLEEKYADFVGEGDNYMISLITDGMHQNLNFFNTYKSLKILDKKNNVLLLDSYLSFFDFIKGFINDLILKFRIKKIFKEKFIFKNIDVSEYIYLELLISFSRIPRLLCYKNAIIQSLTNHSPEKFVFYLHEYSYGRYFNYILSKYFSSIERVGFQHGPASKRKLLYYIGNNMVSNINEDWLLKTPIPNKILSEDELSMKIYKDSGYENVEIMKKIYRLNYLKNIKRNKIEKKSILIVPGLHDGLFLIDKISNYIKKKSDNNFILKPHPRSSIFKNGLPKKYQYKNIKIEEDHVSKYLSIVSKVIATYSSVGIEAYMLNIPVTVVMLPNKINESPLLDIYESGKSNLIDIIW